MNSQPKRNKGPLHYLLLFFEQMNLNDIRWSDPYLYYSSKLIIRFSIIAAIICTIFAIVRLYVVPNVIMVSTLLIGSVILFLIPYIIRFTKSVFLATTIYLGALFIVLTVFASFSSSYPVNHLSYSCLIPMLAVFLLGWKMGIIWTGISVATAFIFFIHASFFGYLKFYQTGVMIEIIPFLLSNVTLYVVTFLVSYSIKQNDYFLKTESYQAIKKIEQSRRLESIGLLAAGVTNEMVNPLSYLISNLELLQSQTPPMEVHLAQQGQSIEDWRISLHESLHGAYQIKEIVDNISSFAQIPESISGPVDLSVCLEKSLTLAKTEWKHDIQISKIYQENCITWGNQERLTLVFLHVLLNVLDMLQNSNKTEKSIIIKTWIHKSKIYTQIVDNGNGIPQEQLDKVFDPFFSTKAGIGGIGLSLSYSIIRSYQGNIEVTSKQNQGCRFVIDLPFYIDDGENDHLKQA